VWPKIVPFLIQAVGPELNLVSWQSARMQLSHKPDSRLPYYCVSRNYSGEVGNAYVISQQIYSGKLHTKSQQNCPSFIEAITENILVSFFQTRCTFNRVHSYLSSHWALPLFFQC